ncbi:MAG TPA: class I SAM-dependent methyltransferase [Candidatus Diapherotrites archaeon]|uniref:Class I SAM-dependent methyltransferase n=1 Tax=Candidatus Iainarchaeum sp. TaxID=3101447 RepID=A0A7J4IWL4_9ARCH|nr:class I SAM-dependent methyltransferase [Candidatus Diapherotrites archaeon]
MDSWDEIYRKVPLDEIAWHSEKPPRPLVDAVRELKGGKALDLCCGAGTNSIFLAKKGFDVTGIDISPAAIGIAKRRAGDEGVKVDFLVGNVLEFRPDRVFDFVFDRGCFHHMSREKRPQFASNLAAMLAKGGRFQLMAFSARNRFEKSLTKDEIRGVFSPYFEVGEIGEELHTEPGGSKVYLYAALMARR